MHAFIKMDLQKQIRQSAECQRNYLEDLVKWEKEMNTKEQEKSTKPSSNLTLLQSHELRKTEVLPIKKGSEPSFNPLEEAAKEQEQIEKNRVLKLKEQQKKSMMSVKHFNASLKIVSVKNVGIGEKIVKPKIYVQEDKLKLTPNVSISVESSSKFQTVTPSCPISVVEVPKKELSIRTLFDFERFMKKEMDSYSRFLILKKIHLIGFRQFFKDSLEPELFMDILKCLNDVIVNEKEAVESMLLDLSKVQRIDCITLSLDDDELEYLKELHRKLNRCDLSVFGL